MFRAYHANMGLSPVPTDQNVPPVRSGGGLGLSSASATQIKHRGITYRTSLVLSISLLVVVTGLTLTLLAFRNARSNTATLADELFQEVSDHAVTKTRAFVQRAVPLVHTLGNLVDLGLSLDDPSRLARQLMAVLQANPGISWLSYSNEAGTFVGAYRTASGNYRINQSRIVDGRTELTESDVLDDGSWKLYRHVNDSGYDPRRRDFYQRAKAAGKIVWMPPYIFYDQGVPGITCANPVYDSTRRFLGVITVDFDLNALSEFISQLSISPNSRLFIITPQGMLLAHPWQRLVVQSGHRNQGWMPTVDDAGDPLLKVFFDQLKQRNGQAGPRDDRTFEFSHDRIPYYAHATTFAVDDQMVWIIGALAPQADFLADVQRHNAMSLGASLLAVLLAVGVAMMLARRVSGPILSLVGFMRSVGAGDLNQRINLRGAQEFRRLSLELNKMIADLRDRLRLRSALNVAMEVQQKLLPARPPNIPGLDIAGYSIYCDETGGDYFDYLMLEESSPTSVLVAIGDVMGHGIAAALLMATARAILRSRAGAGDDLGGLLTHLNDHLAVDLSGSRFMTMYLWRIDSADQSVRLAGAGHDPAIIYDPATGQFDSPERGDLPLGIEPGITYHEQSWGPMRPGQVIVLGTDGIWETVNPQREFYGKDRLRDCIRATANQSAADIASAIQADLTRFRDPLRQRDDVTLVVIKVL